MLTRGAVGDVAHGPGAHQRPDPVKPMVGPGVANQRWREAPGGVDAGAGERDGNETDDDNGEADEEGGRYCPGSAYPLRRRR